MLSDKLVASPLVWSIGALVVIMSVLPSAVALVLGLDQIRTLTNCTVTVASTVYYSKDIITINSVLGAMMMLFLKRWKLALALAVGSFICVYGLIVVGSFVLHAKSVSNVTAPMFGMLMAIYFGDTTAILILLYLLPGIFALNRQKESRRKILVFNGLLGWVPGLWPLLLFITMKDDVQKPRRGAKQ
ncbi:MAG: superinfection immunity protein [Cyanobacteria bacterium]|nr:superinfection immunity protein [Cyanobacteriota bacterium]